MKFSLYTSTFVFFLFLTQAIHSQIVDDFSDGNFSQNPIWVGDAANFKISLAGELQLSTSGAGQSALWVAGNIPDSSIWDFDLRLAFAPSGSNLVRVYLQSDQTDLSIANGYYLELGETGSADAIRMLRQDGAAKVLLGTGQAGLAANSPDLHIRVMRTTSGVWSLEAAPQSSALQAQFSFSDATWTGGTNRFFGVQCVYTSSNSANFFFDNINIRPDVPDTQPPVLISAQADNATQLTLVFDEDLEITSAETPGNYSVNNGIGQANTATLSPDKKTVVLTLSNQLATGSYTIQSVGIADVVGNASATQSIDFQYIKIEAATEFDVLINEIMSDPFEPAGLPEVEWLELYNRSNKIIDLSKLRFADATSAPVALPNHLIQPGEYVALTSATNVPSLQGATTGTVLGLPISTSMLNNESDVLTLSDLSGNIVDRVAYNLDWHTIPGRDDGGYTLERINPALPCLGGENWQSCPTDLGGSPAAQNASFATGSDSIAPRIFKVFPESPSSILLTFTEGMDQFTAENIAGYQLDPPTAIVSAEQLSNDRSLVRLSLGNPLLPSTVYTLSIKNTVEDCSGNPFQFIDTVFLGLAEKPEIQDIVINEILFNPATGGSRYIEFYNRSQKIFDWSEFFLASNSDTTTSKIQVIQERLFLPGEYHVMSSDAPYVREYYANIIKKNVLYNSLPSLDDRSDSIKIYWAGGGKTITIDSFYYRREMHNGLLSTSEQEGVALERIRIDGPTQAASNWTSASPLKTGAPGTPTLPNSQALETVPSVDDLISIPIARLSPDGDEREDFLEIFYRLPKEGYAASLNIYDADGNLVKKLIRQNLIGTEGSVRWDGDTDAGEGVKARPGIHILYFEIFSPDGDVKRVKKAVALIGKF